jgi:hypothetical protein
MEKPKGKGDYRMDDATKEIASEAKEEAKGTASHAKEVTLELAEVMALALTVGIAVMVLGLTLFLPLTIGLAALVLKSAFWLLAII